MYNTYRQAEWSRFGRAPRRHTYRNEWSYQVVQLRVREYGTLSPTDPGDIEQIGKLGVYATQAEAERRIDDLRMRRHIPADECYSVTGRYHDQTGKIVERDADLYVG